MSLCACLSTSLLINAVVSGFAVDLDDPALGLGSMDHLLQVPRLVKVPVEEVGPAVVLARVLDLVLHAPVEAFDKLFLPQRAVWIKIQVVLEADFCAVWYETLVERLEKIQSSLEF